MRSIYFVVIGFLNVYNIVVVIYEWFFVLCIWDFGFIVVILLFLGVRCGIVILVGFVL